MAIAMSLVYDIRLVTAVNPVNGGLEIIFRGGTVAFLLSGHPNFEILRLHAESQLGQPVPLGLLLDADSRVIDLNIAHDTSVQSIQECPEDPNRLKVAFWGYSPVCYLTRDHPDFDRIRATVWRAAGTRTMLWVVHHSEMVADEPKTQDGEFEVWWKILDVRPVQPNDE
jgi:hypothetical protein